MAKVLQWNMRGLQSNREDRSLLLSSMKPTIVALQETNIGKNHNINFHKKAVLPQGNRAMPQVFFSVEVRQQHSLQV